MIEKKFELHTPAKIQAVSWKRCTFSSEILTFRDLSLSDPSDQDPFWKGSPRPKFEKKRCVLNWLSGEPNIKLITSETVPIKGRGLVHFHYKNYFWDRKYSNIGLNPSLTGPKFTGGRCKPKVKFSFFKSSQRKVLGKEMFLCFL